MICTNPNGIYGLVCFQAATGAGYRCLRLPGAQRTEITEGVLESILAECRDTGVPARIIFATGDSSDERVIEDYCTRLGDIRASAQRRLAMLSNSLSRKVLPGRLCDNNRED